jgi:hypothetical protein
MNRIGQYVAAALLSAAVFHGCQKDVDPECECHIPYLNSPDLVYEAGETVKFDGECWVTQDRFISGNFLPSDGDPDRWQVCASSDVFACDCPNEWIDGLSYPAGSIVNFEGTCYIARFDNESIAPMTSFHWNECQ